MAKRGISSSSIKPAFTAQDFVNGIADFENRMADSFFFYVRDQFKKKNVAFQAIEKKYGDGENDTINTEELINSFRKQDQVVFVQDGKAIGELTYSDVFRILERGQHDLGIKPQPVLQKVFDDFRPIYKTALKNFLLGKK